MGQDRIERILAKRRKATEKIVDAHLYNPSKKWGEAEQEPSSDDYSFTSGIEPTKVEKPYPSFSEKVATAMAPATPENIAASLPQYNTERDILEQKQRDFEEKFETDAEYRAGWFKNNTGMTEEEFKTTSQQKFATRLQQMMPLYEEALKEGKAEAFNDTAQINAVAPHLEMFPAAGLRNRTAKRSMRSVEDLLRSFQNNTFWSGLREGFAIDDVLSFGLFDIADANTLGTALSKLEQGAELNKREQLAIEASQLYDDINNAYEILGGRSVWNSIGQGTGESAEFISQMALTGGAGLYGRLSTKLGAKAAKNLILQSYKQGLKKNLATGLLNATTTSGVQGFKMLGRGVWNTGAAYLEGATRSLLMPSTYANYLDTLNAAKKEGADTDKGKAFREALWEQTNEITSEIVGANFLHGTFRNIGKSLGVNRLMNKIGFGEQRRKILGWTPSATTREIMRKAGYTGDYLSEVSSEVYGDISTQLGLQVFGSGGNISFLKDEEYWKKVGGVSAALGLAFGGVNMALNVPTYKKLNAIQKRRDGALLSIQDASLQQQIQAALNETDIDSMGSAFARIDWGRYNRLDAANAFEVFRQDIPLRIATEAQKETARLQRFYPRMEGLLERAYQGIDGNLPQPILLTATVDGKPVRIVAGDYNKPDAMVNIEYLGEDVDNRPTAIIASNLENIQQAGLSQAIGEAYRLMFATEDIGDDFKKVINTLNEIGDITPEEARNIVERAGLKVFGNGDIVSLANGSLTCVVDGEMTSDGYYFVNDPARGMQMVSILDVLQPDEAIASAQIDIAKKEEQRSVVESAPLPEGLQMDEAYVTPQGVGYIYGTNPENGNVLIDINTDNIYHDSYKAQVIEVPMSDLLRKPAEDEILTARERILDEGSVTATDIEQTPTEEIEEPESVATEIETAMAELPSSTPTMENIPTTPDGAVDYEAITDADMYARLLTQDLGSKEEALEAVTTSIEGYTAEVSALQEKAKKEKNMTQRVALTKQAAAMQQHLDVLNEVRESLGEGTNELNGAYTLSDEIDENGRQFVLNSQGDTAFGFIEPDSNLTPAPIMLSEGIITNPATNDGYGLVHIEARHGDQIRKAGYGSVVEFVEEVAKNYEVIKEGKNRNGVQTYLLQLTDKHNNTLMVELSGDGTYYNINTAGIFKTSYGKNRKEVYNRQTTAKQPAEVVETSRSVESNGTQTPPSLIDVSTPISQNESLLDSEWHLTKPQNEGSDLVPTPSVSSESKNTTSVPNMQEVEQKNVGLMQDDFTATLPKGEAELIDSLARSLGLSVEFVDQVNEGNSNAQILGNKVLIAKKNRDKAIKFLVGHEFTHRMQDLSPEAYAEFKAAVKEYMGEEMYNTLLQKEIAKYRQHNIYRTQEQLEDEVIADFAGSLVYETDVLDTFIETHADKKTMWQAILNVLRAIREWFIKDTALDTAEARALQNTIDKLENLFQSASEKVAEGTTTQNTETRRSEKDINTLTEEEQDIIATAKANGTYLKGPNGADTNLTPRQWVQVRTKAFKKWFGDWELAAIAEYLMSDDVVAILNGDEFAKDGTPLTDKVVKYYADNHNGKVERDGLGEVLLDKRSVKDSASHGLGKAKSAAFAAVPNIITEGRIIDSQTNWKGRGYDSVTIAAPIRIGNENYVGVVVVKKSKEFNRFYLHEVMIQKSLRDGVFQTSLNAGNPSGDIAKVIKNIINANNSSKIIDANGEPKVAEHSTWNEDFYTFDINRLGESSGDEGVYGAGFYFGNVGETELYGDRAIQAYLNMRKPLVLPDAPIRGFFDYLVENFDKEGLRDIVVKGGNKATTMGEVVDAIKAVNEAHARGEYAELIEQMSQYWYPAEDRVLEQQIFRKIGLAIYPTLEPFIQYNVGRKEFSEALRNAGYDGVVYDNQEYVAFEPNQIKSADAVTYDDAGNIIPLSERFNPEKEDVRYSAKDIPSLVGIHNISLEKLRKAIKMGGLANPSVAVIDADKQTHEDYGEYSLILPKNMVDARQGKNAGTWAGDAWTPTYPQITKRMSKDKDISRYYKDTDVLPEAMRNRVRLDFNSFMDGRSANALAYWYLFDKGVAPELVDVPARYPVEIVDALNEATNGSFSMFRLSAEERARCLDAFVAYKYKGDRATYDADMAARKERLENFAKNHDKGIVRKKAQEDLDAINEYGFDYDEVSRFIRDVEWDVRHKGETDVDATIKASMDYIAENNLGAEYDAWRNSLDERYGIEEYIFDGYTNSGTPRYLPHTVENASKWMKKQGRQGAVATFPSFGTFVAVSIPKMTTLESIRKRKNLLGKSKEEYDAFREKWENVYFELGKKLQPDAKGFDDYGYWRLIEAVGQKNPKEYIKEQYNIELSAEDVNTLNEMLNAIRTEYPARYFETKFERPLQLNDFVAAVVPDDVPMDVWGRLNDAKVKIFEYEKGNSNSRAEAMQKATATEGVRFSVKDTFYSNAENAVRLIKQEKATPEQWLKMIEKNGGLKAGEDKWLGLSDWLKEQMRGPVKEKPTAININGTEYNVKELEEQILSDIKAMLEEEGFDDELIGIRLVGSYMRGEQRPDSDIDVIVEYKGGSTEDTLFNVLNDEDRRINIGGVDVDINPITEGKSGTLDEWEKRNAGFTKKPITLSKDEVLDYIHQNQIQIEEVEYGDIADISREDIYESSEFDELRSQLTEYDEDDNPYINRERYNELRNESYDFVDGFSLDFWGEELEVNSPAAAATYLGLTKADREINSTRLDYTTKGLANKREIALTVPTIEPWNTSDEIHFGDAGGGRAVAWIRFGETTAPKKVPMYQRVEEFEEPFTNANGRQVYMPKGRRGSKDYIVYGELKDGGSAYVVFIKDKQIPVAHNTLEDARNAMNEYYAANPRMETRYERVLVIDEIQSKRHQEGREKGYKKKEDEELKNAQGAEIWAMMQKYNVSRPVDLRSVVSAEDAARLDELAQHKFGEIPYAPFEKNWAELAMKRMLRYAAENGYDKVAWTTGEQQAERYNLGAVMQGLKAYKTSPNTYYVIPYNNGAIGEFVKEYDEKELAETFGKEIAVSIITNSENATEENPYEMTGDDLRIGGSGMKAFYDQMLPSFVRKYAKKWGATVGEVTMPDLEENNTMHSVDVTPAMRESVMQGQPLFSLKDNQKADEIAYKTRKIGRVYGVNTPMVIAVTPEDYRREVLNTGVKEKDFDPDTSGVYLDGVGYTVINSAVIKDDEELVETIIHEESHRLTHDDEYWQNIADVVASIDSDRLERFSIDILGEIMSPMNVADEIIATFVGQSVIIKDGNGLYLLRGFINGGISIDEVISTLRGKYSQKIKDNYADIVDAMLPFIRTNIETIKTQSNDEGKINGGDVLISGRGYRPSVEETTGDRGLGYRGVQSPSIGEDVRRSQEVSNLEAPEQFARQSLKDNVGDTLLLREIRQRVYQKNIERINRSYDWEEQKVEALAKRQVRADRGYDYKADVPRKLEALCPDGKTALPPELQVIYDIANGLKVRWEDSENGRLRGLQTELGLKDGEKRGYRAIISGATQSLDEYVQNLFEENGGYTRDLDDQVFRDAAIESLRMYPSRKVALKALETALIEKDVQATANEMYSQINRAREEALQAEQQRLDTDISEYVNYSLWLQRGIDVLNNKLSSMRTKRKDQLQRIAEAQRLMRDIIDRMLLQNISITNMRTLTNLALYIAKANSPEALMTALNHIRRIDYETRYRAAKQRRNKLMKSKVDSGYFEPGISSAQYLRRLGYDDTTIQRILDNKFKGQNANGVSIAKYIDAGSSLIMKLVDQYLSYAPQDVDGKIFTNPNDKAKMLSMELEQFLADNPNYQDYRERIMQIPALLEYQWRAEELKKQRDELQKDIDSAKVKIATLEGGLNKDGLSRKERVGIKSKIADLKSSVEAMEGRMWTNGPDIVGYMESFNDGIQEVLRGGQKILSEERRAKEVHRREVVNLAIADMTNFGQENIRAIVNMRKYANDRLLDKKKEELVALKKDLGKSPGSEMLKARISDLEKEIKDLKKVTGQSGFKQATWNEMADNLYYLLNKLSRFALQDQGQSFQYFMGALTNAYNSMRKNNDIIMSRINSRVQALWKGKKGYENIHNVMRRARELSIGTMTFGREEYTYDIRISDRGNLEREYRQEEYTLETALTVTQGLYILAVWNQTDGRMKLEANGVKEEHIANIIRAISKIDERFLDIKDFFIGELLPSRATEYDRVHKEIYGAYMSRVENYYPLRIDGRSRIENVSLDELKLTGEQSLSPSSIINRTKNALMIDIDVDFFQIGLNHLADNERWIALAPIKEDMNALLSDRVARSYMEELFGEGFHSRLKKAMMVSLGTFSDKAPGGALNEAYAYLTRRWAGSRVSMKIMTALKQLTGAGVYLFYAESPEYLKYIYRAASLKPETFKKYMEKFPMLKARWESQTAGMVELTNILNRKSEKIQSKARERLSDIDNFFDELMKLGLRPNVICDLFVSGIMAEATYNYEYDRMRKKGYSETIARENAYQAAERSYNATQQSSEAMYLSAGQVSSNILYRSVTTFRNNPIANMRLAMMGARELYRVTAKWEKVKHNIYKSELLRIQKEQQDKVDAINDYTDSAMSEQELQAYKQGELQRLREAQAAEAYAIAQDTKNKGYVYRGVARALWGAALNASLFTLMGYVPELIWNWVTGDDDEDKTWLNIFWDGALFVPTNLPVISLGTELFTRGTLSVVPAFNTIRDDWRTLTQAMEESDFSIASIVGVTNIFTTTLAGVDLKLWTRILEGAWDIGNGDIYVGALRMMGTPNATVKAIVGARKDDETLEKYMNRILRTQSVLEWNKVEREERRQVGQYIVGSVLNDDELRESRLYDKKELSNIRKVAKQYNAKYQRDILNHIQDREVRNNFYSMEKDYEKVLQEYFNADGNTMRVIDRAIEDGVIQDAALQSQLDGLHFQQYELMQSLEKEIFSDSDYSDKMIDLYYARKAFIEKVKTNKDKLWNN